MVNQAPAHTRQGEKLEEVGNRLLFRVYEWGRNTSADAEKLENELTLAVLAAFETSLRSLVRGWGGTISELTDSIRSRVEAGIGEAEKRIMDEVDESYAMLKDADLCDRNLKRCELAAKYVRQKTEAKILAVSSKGADAAVSYVLRESEKNLSKRDETLRKIGESEIARHELETRLAKLNVTFRDAVTKFVGNRKTLLEEIDRAETRAIAAERETATAKSLYEKVARKAAEADRIANLLKGFWKAGTAPVAELTEMLNELRRANVENGTFRQERTTYQRTTARNFELERQISLLSETMTGLENRVRAEIAARIEAEESADALSKETPQIETELRMTSWAYYAVMLRMEGSDPEAQDYSDYGRLEKELGKWIRLAQSKGTDAFSVAAKSVALARDEWLSSPESLKGIGVSRVSAQAAYEKCVREIGRITVPQSVRDVAEKLRIYSDVAGITGWKSRRETIVDAEFR